MPPLGLQDDRRPVHPHQEEDEHPAQDDSPEVCPVEQERPVDQPEVPSGAHPEPRHGQRRDEGDRDRHPRNDRRELLPPRYGNDGAHEPREDGDREVERRGAGALRDLEGDRLEGEGHGEEGAGRQHREGAQHDHQPGLDGQSTVADGECHGEPQDRSQEWRHEHGPDHDGGAVDRQPERGDGS